MQDVSGHVIVDSYRFLPRSFRPLYEGRGPFRSEEEPVWTPFAKRLSEAKIALLTSAGVYMRDEQQPFDVEAERARPEWGDPSWRAIPAGAGSHDLGVSHLHINTADVQADPEIALPSRLLAQLADEKVIGAAAQTHFAVMGYQDRHLHDWRDKTAPEIAASLHADRVDGLILAPA
ncbi:MAG TPA: glycine/sarcosine/betaine reductase selenoprotein B family protein [Candidatus Dormibacteraeota bacterium]|nr:glycine/sarcosine/betaine reductase selenoprotein B family protein [Candidatus Dormibacteraeota bacterium]